MRRKVGFFSSSSLRSFENETKKTRMTRRRSSIRGLTTTAAKFLSESDAATNTSERDDVLGVFNNNIENDEKKKNVVPFLA